MTIYHVKFAATKIGVPLPRMVGLAYEYAEEHISAQKAANEFLDLHNNGIVSEVVSDFTLDILAGRVTQTQLLQ